MAESAMLIQKLFLYSEISNQQSAKTHSCPWLSNDTKMDAVFTALEGIHAIRALLETTKKPIEAY